MQALKLHLRMKDSAQPMAFERLISGPVQKRAGIDGLLVTRGDWADMPDRTDGREKA
jgi:hypothetical protein